MRWLSSKYTLAFLVLLFASTGFYVVARGYPQPGHIAVLLLTAPLLLNFKSIRLGLAEGLLLAFWLYSCVVNLTYWFEYQDPSFLVSMVYWTYGLALFFSVRQLMLNSPTLGAAWPYSLMTIVVVLLLLFLLGGDQFYVDRRFIGSFGDPNQMSYWLLCAFVASLLSAHKSRWFDGYGVLPIFVVILFLAFLAGSRSTLLALGVVFVGLLGGLISGVQKDPACIAGRNLSNRSPRRLIRMMGLLLALLLLSIYLLYQFNDNFTVAVDDFARRMTTHNVEFQLKIRGYTRLFEFPEYLIFGAGQGLDSRFIEPIDGHVFEVHSSIVSPLFYYGLVGFGLLLTSFYVMARDRLQRWQWFVFAGPFVYGLFTYGLRTPIFWLMLATLFTIAPKVKQ